ncbi:MAG TPA: hypothetical protein VLN57_05090 [Xanthobacteraceae bacterium]|nr:hypothetical protein [Xanthobacteraceae bacterium]
MFSIDPATGSLIVPLWMSVVALALVVVMTIFAIARAGGARTVVALIGIVALAYAGWIGWTIAEHAAASQRNAEREALAQRAMALAASAQAPGTALGCLEGMAGEQVEIACERAVFATPDTVAAAVTHVATQLGLLADALAAARASDARYDTIIGAARRGLEADRYGIVAHVLLQEDNCSAEQCEILNLLSDANRVRSNLREKPFNALVAKYAPSWANARLGPPVADLSRALPPSAPGSPSGVPVSSKYEFPSSSSIPPVNIMGSETSPAPPAAGAQAPAAPGGSAAAAEAPPVPPRRPANAARPRAPRAAAGAPAQPAQSAPPSSGFQQ